MAPIILVELTLSARDQRQAIFPADLNFRKIPGLTVIRVALKKQIIAPIPVLKTERMARFALVPRARHAVRQKWAVR